MFLLNTQRVKACCFYALVFNNLPGIIAMQTLPILCILLYSFAALQDSPRVDAATEMVAAATLFLSEVQTKDLDQVQYSFNENERTNWHFVPIKGQRKGMALEDMSQPQREAVHHLLRAALSTEGYLKVTAIQQLEQLLGELENRPAYRNPGHYYLTIFGNPGLEAVWGWRFEGHHLSINFSLINGQISTTPTFMGANPGEVRSSVFGGLQVLSAEITLARQLIQQFDENQLNKAIIATKAPRDIITGNSRQALLSSFEGLAFSEMTPHQQDGLLLLISAYVNNLAPEIAATQLKRIQSAGMDHLYFSWAGSLNPGEPHYYRIHGPNVLIEYDNVQNNANHVHTVWRDLDNDFGEDYLKNHYERDH